MPSCQSLALAAGLLATLCSPALADATFVERFDGRFSGSGTIQREEDTAPRRVSCTVTGSQPSPRRLALSGTCRAAVIVRRAIGADIRYDAGSDRFSGTYTGSTKGTARLTDGRLTGDTLRFTLTYPVVVHGDRTATMTIRNAGSGTFSVVVTDEVDGTARETSAITLRGG